MYKCHCCSNAGEKGTLIGGRHVWFCDDCANKCIAWLTSHRVYREWIRHNSHRAYLDSRGLAASEEDWLNHFERGSSIKAELFYVTGLWLEEHKAKPKESEVKEPLSDDQL